MYVEIYPTYGMGGHVATEQTEINWTTYEPGDWIPSSGTC